MNQHFNFDAAQVEAIINKVVPLVAKKEDHEFFRGVLFCKADACKSGAEFAAFIKKMLDMAGGCSLMASISSKEHYDMMEFFEKTFKGRWRMDREEDKTLWAKGAVYQHGEANAAFLAFRQGVAYGKHLNNDR